MRPPQTIARAGDDGDASVKPDCHEVCSRFSSWPGQTQPSIKIMGIFEQ
jgi:hypothetical protein